MPRKSMARTKGKNTVHQAKRFTKMCVFAMTERQHAALMALAAKEDTTASALLREAIDEYLLANEV